MAEKQLGTAPVNATDIATKGYVDDKLFIDFRDHGMIGDGTSRPLSTLFGTLAAAQAVYPAAVALSDELDWAAMQSAVNAHPGDSFLVHSTVHAITNRPLDPTDYSVWTVDGIIENIWPRNTPTASQDRAAVFHGGNMHPIVLNTGNFWTANKNYLLNNVYKNGDNYYKCTTAGTSDASGTGPTGTGTGIVDGTAVWSYYPVTADPFRNAFPTYALANITKGDRAVTVNAPTGLSLNVGDKVIVRSSTGEYNYGNTGFARNYDFMQFNKVVSYNSATGVVTLELPVDETIASNSFMTGPTLCVITGTDTNNGQQWRMLDGFELRGNGKVMGTTIFGKMGMWQCRATIKADCQQLVSCNAAVRCHFDISGTFTSRCLEVAFASWESTFIVDGTFKPDPQVIPASTISIGEQSTGNDFTIRCFRGTDHTASNVILQDAGIRSTIRATLYDYSVGDETGADTSVVFLKSSPFPNRPPTDNTYDFFIRTRAGKARYLLVGSSASDGDGTAFPRRLRWSINAKSDSSAPSYLEHIISGRNMVRGPTVADTMRCFVASNFIEPPQNAPVLVSTITGPRTFDAKTNTLLGNFTLSGARIGDYIDAQMYPLQSPLTVSGSFGDLVATAALTSTYSVRVYVYNRSDTDVVMESGNIFQLWLTWRQTRAIPGDFVP